MAVGAIGVEKLAAAQRQAIAGVFGAEVPSPPDRLLEVVEKNERERLFDVDALRPFYLPGRQLAEGVVFPGLKRPLNPWLYVQIREGRVDADADWLPEGWILLDMTKRPNYDNGKQMYPDTSRFKEMLADLREQDKIAVPDPYSHVRKDSRFAILPEEIDGKGRFVANRVAAVLSLRPGEQIATPRYVVGNYICNLADPKFGQVNTSEWFADKFERSQRLRGGDSADGGLALIGYWQLGLRRDDVGFRLQISFPSKA